MSEEDKKFMAQKLEILRYITPLIDVPLKYKKSVLTLLELTTNLKDNVQLSTRLEELYGIYKAFYKHVQGLRQMEHCLECMSQIKYIANHFQIEFNTEFIINM